MTTPKISVSSASHVITRLVKPTYVYLHKKIGSEALEKALEIEAAFNLKTTDSSCNEPTSSKLGRFGIEKIKKILRTSMLALR